MEAGASCSRARAGFDASNRFAAVLDHIGTGSDLPSLFE